MSSMDQGTMKSSVRLRRGPSTVARLLSFDAPGRHRVRQSSGSDLWGGRFSADRGCSSGEAPAGKALRLRRRPISC